MGNSPFTGNGGIREAPYGLRKIDYAVNAARKFVAQLMSTDDNFAVSAFSSDYTLVQGFTSNEPAVHSSIASLPRRIGSGTAFRDALLMSSVEFLQHAHRDRPWILILITDGDDNSSQSTTSQCAEMLRKWNGPDSNFGFMLGVGHDVNSAVMQQLARSSGMMYIPIENAEVLEIIFAVIALQVVSGQQISLASLTDGSGSEAIWARVRQYEAVRRQPMDVLFCIDVSPSMLESH
ncbi:hypothetical protein PAPYR_4993 [Paratrimastix pyriformis]|uniref:VWFA domain-containing protein n=1 Tax=Paratrimastix pyriformis TaxID=342808 RepID=A0ABQ8UL79_9EUKA|nr:hypothetical protein PAPYR_4993 [Paratrimastix pyriformis]